MSNKALSTYLKFSLIKAGHRCFSNPSLYIFSDLRSFRFLLLYNADDFMNAAPVSMSRKFLALFDVYKCYHHPS